MTEKIYDTMHEKNIFWWYGKITKANESICPKCAEHANCQSEQTVILCSGFHLNK